MKEIKREDLNKIFKKVKNFKSPRGFDEIDFISLKFLGWWNQTANKVFIVHEFNGELEGIAFDVMRLSSRSFHRAFCEICEKHRKRDEILMVSARTKKKPKDVERRIRGVYICSDLTRCEKDAKDTLNLDLIFHWIIEAD